MKENKYSFDPEGHTAVPLPVRTKDIFDLSSQISVWLLCSCVCRLCVAQTHSFCLSGPVLKGVGHQNMNVLPQSLVHFMLNKLVGVFLLLLFSDVNSQNVLFCCIFSDC